MGREHVASFNERGFAVVRGVFDAKEVAEMAAAFDRIKAEGLAHPAAIAITTCSSGKRGIQV